MQGAFVSFEGNPMQAIADEPASGNPDAQRVESSRSLGLITSEAEQIRYRENANIESTDAHTTETLPQQAEVDRIPSPDDSQTTDSI